MAQTVATYLNPIKHNNEPFILVDELQSLCSAARDANNTDHFHDFYTIYLLQSGEVSYVTEHLQERIPTPGMLFIGPGIRHRMEIAENVKGHSVIFNDAFVNLDTSNFFLQLPFFRNDQIYALLPLQKEMAKDFEHLIKMMSSDHHGTLNGNGLLLKNYLNVLLLKAQQYQLTSPIHAGTTIPTAHHSTLIEFKKLVNTQYTFNRQVGDYANQLNMQPDCLNEVTKSLSGVTASELIRNKVLDEARRLIYTTSLSFKEIALKLGFDDAAYFSRYFKKYTGQTLKEFKGHITELSK